MKPFDHNKFVGYICEVTPQYVRMQIPSARLLHSFYFRELYALVPNKTLAGKLP